MANETTTAPTPTVTVPPTPIVTPPTATLPTPTVTVPTTPIVTPPTATLPTPTVTVPTTPIVTPPTATLPTPTVIVPTTTPRRRTRHGAGDPGSTQMPGCFRDNRKMCLAASLSTMLFSILCIGFLVNDLMAMVSKMDILTDRQRYKRTRGSYEDNNSRSNRYSPPTGFTDQDKAEMLHELTISKVMYTVLICDLVLLLISSLALLKGVFQKKCTLIIVWIAIVTVTVLYAGGLIVRDIHIEMAGESRTVYSKNLSSAVSAKLGVYSFFVIMEAGFMRHVVAVYKQIKHNRLLTQANTACFDPRRPGHSIFTISNTSDMTPQNHEDLFKLPTYEEVTAEATEGKSTEENEEDPRGKPPPYEPPDYSTQ